MDRSVDVSTQLRVDLSRPRYDQRTFSGRARYFFETANPLNLLASNKRLEKAAELVKLYRYDQGDTSNCTFALLLTKNSQLYVLRTNMGNVNHG